jgi:hypothetical protein
MNMSSALHPAEAIEPSVRLAEGRAKLAIAALSLTLASRAFTIFAALSQHALLAQVQSGRQVEREQLAASDVLVGTAALVQLALLFVTAVLFLRWLHRTTMASRMLGALVLWSPSDAVWAFFIPFVNIKRPYEVVKNLHDALLDPQLPQPQATVVADGAGGYRSVQLDAPPPPNPLPAAAVGAWWATYWVSGIMGSALSRSTNVTVEGLMERHVGTVMSSLLQVVSAVLAIVMVRGVTARLAERYRRVRFSTPESLQAAGVVLAPPIAG